MDDFEAARLEELAAAEAAKEFDRLTELQRVLSPRDYAVYQVGHYFMQLSSLEDEDAPPEIIANAERLLAKWMQLAK